MQVKDYDRFQYNEGSERPREGAAVGRVVNEDKMRKQADWCPRESRCSDDTERAPRHPHRCALGAYVLCLFGSTNTVFASGKSAQTAIMVHMCGATLQPMRLESYWYLHPVFQQPLQRLRRRPQHRRARGLRAALNCADKSTGNPHSVRLRCDLHLRRLVLQTGEKIPHADDSSVDQPRIGRQVVLFVFLDALVWFSF